MRNWLIGAAFAVSLTTGAHAAVKEQPVTYDKEAKAEADKFFAAALKK